MNPIPAALVTGASRGLGRGIAVSCARAGCHVAIHYQGNESAARETRKLCEAARVQREQQFALVKGNIGVSGDRKNIFEETFKNFGRLDALINNAGMAPRLRADVTEMSEESYDEVMGVNLKGPHFLSQLA